MLIAPTGCCAASDSSLSTFCRLNCTRGTRQAKTSLKRSFNLSLNDHLCANFTASYLFVDFMKAIYEHCAVHRSPSIDV